MKRYLILLLSLLVVMAFVTACGPDNDTDPVDSDSESVSDSTPDSTPESDSGSDTETETEDPLETATDAEFSKEY